MKEKKYNGHLLTNKEMKEVAGGHVFPVSQCDGRCPACGEWIEIGTYTYYLICPKCGGNITLEEKKEE